MCKGKEIGVAEGARLHLHLPRMLHVVLLLLLAILLLIHGRHAILLLHLHVLLLHLPGRSLHTYAQRFKAHLPPVGRHERISFPQPIQEECDTLRR